jgi:hypothetical protein
MVIERRMANANYEFKGKMFEREPKMSDNETKIFYRNL